jgi:crotonobetainyl-CoA:carnitine CoA-transferase CaiB-like acyl-CoA transferase
MAGPLSGVKVLDFSTLLPGPMATLFLAEAGAEVIKVERPGTAARRASRSTSRIRLGAKACGH